MPGRPRRRSPLFGWWYISIGAGFLLLGINRLIAGDGWPMIALRWLIAAGFFTLGYFELRAGRKE